MESTHIAAGILVIYFIYKSVYMLKAFLVDKTEEDSNTSIDKAHGKGTFLLLLAVIFILLLGRAFVF